MARPRAKLDHAKEAAEVLRGIKREKAGWKRERLLAIRHGLEGRKSLAEIASACGRSRATIQTWFDAYRRGGVEELLTLRRGKGPSSWLSPEIAEAFRKMVARGQWRRAADAQRWLQKEHGLEVALTTVYKYLGKSEARLKVPRPSHARKDEKAAETFKKELAARLKSLELEPSRPVRLWVVDELRYGLQPVTRRVWSLKGERVVVEVEPCFEWGYVYGALQVAGGGCEFFYSPTVNLECSNIFLKQIAMRDPNATHVVIWDGAGFHQRDTAPDVPPNIRLITLPPYSPELNPVEKLWDIVKDALCNKLFDSLEEAQQTITSTLQEYWNDASRVFRLVGHNWLLSQANSSYVTIIPV